MSSIFALTGLIHTSFLSPLPDYETIFVNNPDAVAPIRDGSEGTVAPPIDSKEIDKILTNRCVETYRVLYRRIILTILFDATFLG